MEENFLYHEQLSKNPDNDYWSIEQLSKVTEENFLYHEQLSKNPEKEFWSAEQMSRVLKKKLSVFN